LLENFDRKRIAISTSDRKRAPKRRDLKTVATVNGYSIGTTTPDQLRRDKTTAIFQDMYGNQALDLMSKRTDNNNDDNDAIIAVHKYIFYWQAYYQLLP
jgi:hypothetical protein